MLSRFKTFPPIITQERNRNMPRHLSASRPSKSLLPVPEPLLSMAATGRSTGWQTTLFKCRNYRLSKIPKATMQPPPMKSRTGLGTRHALTGVLTKSGLAIPAMQWKSLLPKSGQRFFAPIWKLPQSQGKIMRLISSHG